MAIEQRDGQQFRHVPNAGMNHEVPIDEFRTLWRNPGELIKHRRGLLEARGEPIVERTGEAPISLRIKTPVILTPDQALSLGAGLTEGGRLTLIQETDAVFRMYIYGDKTTGEEHVAIIKNLGNGENVPIRIHSSCLTAESFSASNCDCMEQMDSALAIAEKEGFGGVIWLHQEGRGNGLVAKAQQLALMMAEGLDTVEAFERAGYPGDQRDYTAAADILKDLGIKSIRIITNSPDKITQIRDAGIEIVGRIPCEIAPLNDVVARDLEAKRKRFGHLFEGK